MRLSIYVTVLSMCAVSFAYAQSESSTEEPVETPSPTAAPTVEEDASTSETEEPMEVPTMTTTNAQSESSTEEPAETPPPTPTPDEDGSGSGSEEPVSTTGTEEPVETPTMTPTSMSSASGTEAESLYLQFQNWSIKYNRTYKSTEEETHRFHVWATLDRRIRKHNNSGSSWKMGHNQFSDMTRDEVLDYNHMHKQIHPDTYHKFAQDQIESLLTQLEQFAKQQVDTISEKERHRAAQQLQQINNYFIAQNKSLGKLEKQIQQLTSKNGLNTKKLSKTASKLFSKAEASVKKVANQLIDKAGLSDLIAKKEQELQLRNERKNRLNEITKLIAEKDNQINLHSSLRTNSKTSRKLQDQVNWVDAGAVTGVLDQGSCGACWAFAANVAIEGNMFITGTTPVSLSEQELVDCSTTNNLGCNGGDGGYAFSDIISWGGVCSNADYPFTQVQGTCQDCTIVEGSAISSYSTYDVSDEALKTAISLGPAYVAVFASDWFYYESGTFDSCTPDQPANHAVGAVGYGVDDAGVEYYLLKNSWGTSWGESGYMKLAAGDNPCAVQSRILTVA